jgi:hypothetical protein
MTFLAQTYLRFQKPKEAFANSGFIPFCFRWALRTQMAALKAGLD